MKNLSSIFTTAKMTMIYKKRIPLKEGADLKDTFNRKVIGPYALPVLNVLPDAAVVNIPIGFQSVLPWAVVLTLSPMNALVGAVVIVVEAVVVVSYLLMATHGSMLIMSDVKDILPGMVKAMCL
jgi:hypothetical protein